MIQYVHVCVCVYSIYVWVGGLIFGTRWKDIGKPEKLNRVVSSSHPSIKPIRCLFFLYYCEGEGEGYSVKKK